jgi:diguanylate cyclase (GGDEF)-like protein
MGPRILIALGFGVAVAHLAVALVAPGSVATGWLINAAFVTGAALCLWRAASTRRERVAWVCVGAGLLCQALADRYYKEVLQSSAHVSQPSVSDFGFLAFYPLVGVAIVLMLRARVQSVTRSLALDAAVAALAVLTLVATFVFSDVLTTSGGDLSATITNLAYPIADLILLGLLVGGTQMLTKRSDRGLILMGAALILFVVADVIYLYGAAAGTYAPGGWLDAFWSFAAIAMGVAAWQRERPQDRETWEPSQRALITVAAAILVAAAMQVWDHFEHSTAVAVYLTTATILAALARLVVALKAEQDTREELAVSEARYQELALHDPLTGLANRSLLTDRLDHLFTRRAPFAPAALIMVDLDYFKDVNDSLGHAAGDELLTQVATRLRRCVRPEDTVARFGGDEFSIVMTTDDERIAIRCGERIAAALRRPYQLAGKTVDSSASVGVAVSTSSEETSAVLELHADLALYEAKAKGRAQSVFYRAELDASARSQRATSIRS